MVPRWLAPAVLAVITVAAAAAALHAPGPRRSRLAGLASPQAPVLSVRRAPSLLADTIAAATLTRRLDAAMADPAVANSCLIVERNGRRLYDRNPDRSLIPASNFKLLTALAALAKLGPDETFATTAKSTAPISPDGTVNGPLYLVGGGDPLLETADYAASFENQPQTRTPFEALADALVAKGLKHVTGGVLGDESRYDAQRYVPTWKPRYIADSEVGPQSALLVNDGFAQFKPKRIAAASPAVHAAQVLTDLLRGRGVLIDGPAGQSQAPASAATISELRSPPVKTVVAEMLKESDNTTAELLAKELGRRAGGAGTTKAGVKAIHDQISAAGLPAAQVSSVDGSGLDRSDRATCAVLVDVLDTGPSTAPLQQALPVAAREGTLAKRFLNSPAAGRLRAKTGALQGVIALSGLVDPAEPRQAEASPLVFSMLVNDLPQDAIGRALQETVGGILARYPEAPAPADLAPGAR